MPETTRVFHLADLLSVVSGRAISVNPPPDHLDGLYAILSHMVGHSVQTFALPGAADRAKPALIRQFPFLATIEVPRWTDAATQMPGWLAAQVELHGSHFEVEAL